MGYNKFNYNGNVIIDLTGDDVTQADVLAGKQFTANDGEHYLGSMPEREEANAYGTTVIIG